jgi:hypothetical protein
MLQQPRVKETLWHRSSASSQARRSDRRALPARWHATARWRSASGVFIESYDFTPVSRRPDGTASASSIGDMEMIESQFTTAQAGEVLS